LQLGILYAKGEGVGQDYGTAAIWFRAAAGQGNARAQYDLGVMNEQGRGVPVDLHAATEWYRKAAAAGHPLAQYNLAVAYTKGQGIDKNLSEAAIWYRRAAGQGVLPAMVALAVLNEQGEGVAASAIEAYAWYAAAGQRGSTESARRAEEILGAMPKLDRIRAEALARNVAASIRDGEARAGLARPDAAAHPPAADAGPDGKSAGVRP
jgi:TPR repeat protein